MKHVISIARCVSRFDCHSILASPVHDKHQLCQRYTRMYVHTTSSTAFIDAQHTYASPEKCLTASRRDRNLVVDKLEWFQFLWFNNHTFRTFVCAFEFYLRNK